MNPKYPTAETVDEYIALFPSNVQDRLKHIRKLALELIPDVEESISYGIPAYKSNKRRVVYFGAYEKHIGLYPLPKSAPKGFMQELEQHVAGRGTARFYHDKPLSLTFITDFIKYRYIDSQQGR